MTLSSIVEKIIDHHSNRYRTDDSELIPSIMTIRGNDIVSLFTSPNVADSSLKALTHSIITSLIIRDHADAYIISSEVWLSHDLSGPPSENHDRVERLMIAAYSKDETIHKMLVMDRSVPNMVILRESSEFNETEIFQSRFNIYQNLQ